MTLEIFGRVRTSLVVALGPAYEPSRTHAITRRQVIAKGPLGEFEELIPLAAMRFSTADSDALAAY